MITLAQNARRAFGGLIVLACTSVVWAQALRFDHLSVEEGLSNFALTKIVQDQQGFLWFGTEDGLNKYDGYQFIVYKPDPADSSALPGRFIRALHVDHAGMLWVATETGGLCRYNAATDKFERFRARNAAADSLAGRLVTDILEDQRGNLWIGTMRGLYCYEAERGELVSYHSAALGAAALRSEKISSLCADRDGNLWLGTTDAGFARFDRATKTFQQHRCAVHTASALGSNIVSCLRESAHTPGVLWIGTAAGLYRYDVRNDICTLTTLPPDVVFDLFFDSKGTLWVGTFHIGLWRYDAATQNFISYQHDPRDPHALSEDRISCIFEDRSGVMWAGTYRHGLNRFERRHEVFTRYPVGEVYAIRQDHKGELWLGTNSAGLLRYDAQGKLVAEYRNAAQNATNLAAYGVLALCEDRSGELWVGTGHGLSRFNRARNRFEHYLHQPFDATLPEHYEVKAVYEDRAGALWIGTKGSGLARFDRATKTYTYYRHDPRDPHSISGNSIWAITSDAKEDLWIGTFGGGLNRWDRSTGTFEHYQFEPHRPNRLSNNAIYALHIDEQNRVWIGTFGGGLNRLEPSTGEIVHYTDKNGLPDNYVKSILPDAHGNLWLSTDRGLCQFNPVTETCKNFTTQDGLLSNQFLSGACFKNAAGKLFFGGEGGVIAFAPDSLKANPHVPPVAITRFSVFDKPLALPQTLAATTAIPLSYQQNFFSFDFVALDFRAPLKNQYAYKLEGVDPDWVQSGTRRFASYTNVAPGSYTFRVQGANSDGVWNRTGAALRIVITPPFWQTWWFRFLAAASVLVGAWVWYQQRISRLEEKRRALEAQVKERTAFADALQHALIEVENLKDRLEAENVYLQDEIKLEHDFGDIISRSEALKRVLRKVEQVAATDATVLLLGESGTGKELLARAVHNLSPRRDRPLVKVNCAALPANLVESELFGHEKGAFTGALARKIGRFELAHGGTIFLDEIGELPLELQAKLLRVLQEGEFERVGSTQTLKVDARVMAATNRDLKEEIAQGRFREDLFYRLHVFPITIPPLRERREDIPLLLNHFVKKYSQRTGKRIETVSQNIIATLQAYDWPGNVRELENVIERAVIVSQGKQLKLDEWLPQAHAKAEEPGLLTLEEMERRHIRKVLEQTGWRISGERGAAKLLDLNASTLRSRMEKLGIRR